MKKLMVLVLFCIFLCSCSTTNDTILTDTSILQPTPEVSTSPAPSSVQKELFDSLNIYNTFSSSDENFIYLGGEGKIIKFDPVTSSATILYSSPNLIGAAVSGNYIYFIQHTITADGVYAHLMRILKDGGVAESLKEINTSYYDLQIYDSILSLRKYEHSLYSFDYYLLDENNNLVKEINEELPDSKHIYMDPLYSLNTYDAIYEAEPIVESGRVTFIKTTSNESCVTNEIHADIFSGSNIFLKDSNTILFKNHLEQICCFNLVTGEEILIYDNPSSNSITLLNLENNWIYFSQTDSENNRQILYRTNLESSETEQIYTLETGSIHRLSVYGNYVFFYCNDNYNFYWMYEFLP